MDNLSWIYYGDLSGITRIIEANPAVPVYPIYPVGTRLVIPIIDDMPMETNPLLPPWLR